MKILRVLLALIFVQGLNCVEAKPPPKEQPPKEDLQLRDFLRALQNYVTKKNFNSGYRLRSNEEQDNSLEKDVLSPIDEDEAESQTVLIGDKNVKPKNLHFNKEQEMDDSKDKHPLPPVVGIKSNIATRNFGISRSTLWANGVIPYQVAADSFGPDYSKAVDILQNTVANISKSTCVKWRPKTSTDKYFVKITGDSDGCYSFVGNIERENGQILNLGRGCLDGYVVLHEMHHAMGGIHEQQRKRRKMFVKINWENIDKNKNEQYALRRHTENIDVYDYASILQYHFSAFTSNGKPTMTLHDQDLTFLISESKYDLSFYDKAEINKVYDCTSEETCTVSCQNEGFRMQAVDQTTCHCHCPSGLKGPTCEELDTDEGCGKTIILSNGGSDEINMTPYSSGKICTWLVKAESDSLIKATVTSIDLPFSSQDDCYHWIELRYYLIGDRGKELCGRSKDPRTFTQINTGKASPFLIRFNSKKHHTPGTGFTVKVEAIKSGCISSPCKTGSLCIEGSGDGSYMCECQNGLSGKNCDEFGASSSNQCNFEDDFGTCLFDQDPASEILWSFNTRLCSFNNCARKLTHSTEYQFLTLTPYYDSVDYSMGSNAVLKTTAKFTVADRCLSFEYAIGNYALDYSLTELNVYVEGTGKSKTKVKNVWTTDYSWKTEMVSIKAIDNLVISIEGVIGYQIIGVDNISLRPGLCKNTHCNPNPCQNGGTCNESSLTSGSNFVCVCQTGFSGELCETKDTCAGNTCETHFKCLSHPCQNGGSCIETNNEQTPYKCECGEGYPGSNCEGRSCQFENEIDPACFLQTNQSSWQRNLEQPYANPIKAYKGNHYLYLNSSLTDGRKNYFFDKNIAFKDRDYCLTFAYYMNGENVGWLLVYMYTKQNGFQEQFKQRGMLGNEWQVARINLHLNQLSYIAFQGYMETSWLSFGNIDNSSIALDDIQLLPHRCP